MGSPDTKREMSMTTRFRSRAAGIQLCFLRYDLAVHLHSHASPLHHPRVPVRVDLFRSAGPREAVQALVLGGHRCLAGACVTRSTENTAKRKCVCV